MQQNYSILYIFIIYDITAICLHFEVEICQ